MRVLRGVVYMTKRSGPRTEPCGTPQEDVCQEDRSVYARLADEGCNPTPDGRQYVGQKSVTVSGIPCKAWASTSPHRHQYTEDSMYPDGSVTDASNYCRNPDSNWDGGIWCYTTDPNKIWELCSVPNCGKLLC